MSSPIAQVGLVHGGGIEQVPFHEGEFRLQPGSVARAEKGVELFGDGRIERLLFSGGNAHGHDLPLTEAGLMADIAVRAGVPPGRIDVEPDSSSTIGNWANSLGMIEAMDAESVLGVTGRVARPRAEGIGRLLIAHYGLNVELTGYTTTKEPLLGATSREALAIPAATIWLVNAARKGRPLAELDTAYRDRRNHSPVAKVKEHFTHR